MYPLTNQRNHEGSTWLSYYIRARVEAGLHQQRDWNFHSRRALKATSPQLSILITGSFQKVLRYGRLNLYVRRTADSPLQEQEFSASFSEADLDLVIDRLTKKIGLWISPTFSSPELSSIAYGNSWTEKAFRLRRQLLEGRELPDEVELLDLTLNYPELQQIPDHLSDLIEGILILSMNRSGRARLKLQKQAEELLRGAVREHPRHAGLRALLAELFYLKTKQLDWVEKTAEEAIALDAQNDLAYLLLALARGFSTGSGKEALLRLVAINPWLFSSSSLEAAAHYQGGILKNELKQAAAAYQKMQGFDPFSPRP